MSANPKLRIAPAAMEYIFATEEDAAKFARGEPAHWNNSNIQLFLCYEGDRVERIGRVVRATGTVAILPKGT